MSKRSRTSTINDRTLDKKGELSLNLNTISRPMKFGRPLLKSSNRETLNRKMEQDRLQLLGLRSMKKYSMKSNLHVLDSGRRQYEKYKTNG